VIEMNRLSARQYRFVYLMRKEVAALKEITEKIKAAHKIIILTHVSPDPDALCSSFALCNALCGIGKAATVLLCEELAKSLQYIGGDYSVYSATERYEADLIICVDCGDLGRLDCARSIVDGNQNSVINIDHHKDNTYFGTVNFVCPNAAATGELIFRLIREWKTDLTQTEARWLYTAISADTGGFRYSNTTPETMRIAADLMEYEFDFREISKELFETVDYNLLKLKARVMEQVVLSPNGQIAYVSISDELLRQFDVKEEDAYSMVDIARSIRGVEIAFSLKERNHCIKISLRSEKKADVGKIANYFGGGGHMRAAGITMSDVTMEEAARLVLDACEKELEGRG
jgi:phosphoesterase RecJ-like protein